ncbi:MAG TPA: hypothetical protein VOA41_21495 [Candidatus Dormibacteraeota bacterium]|nr:hypothetical protein [Candidatus Dormibacteraeota bacterium]
MMVWCQIRYYFTVAPTGMIYGTAALRSGMMYPAPAVFRMV